MLIRFVTHCVVHGSVDIFIHGRKFTDFWCVATCRLVFPKRQNTELGSHYSQLSNCYFLSQMQKTTLYLSSCIWFVRFKLLLNAITLSLTNSNSPQTLFSRPNIPMKKAHLVFIQIIQRIMRHWTFSARQNTFAIFFKLWCLSWMVLWNEPSSIRFEIISSQNYRFHYKRNK